MAVTTLSQKYQVVIPKEVRKKMHLAIGSKIVISSINEDTAIIYKEPEDPVDALAGLGKEMWKKLGGADAYLKRERDSWEK